MFQFHVPHYFSKSVRREIEDLSFSTGLGDFATAMITIFEPIFLYSVLHFTVQQILLFMAVVYIVYLPCITFGAKFASRYGYKHSIIFSIPFQILFWVLLLAAQTNHIFIYLAPVMWGLEKSFFWPGFHGIVARFGSREQKGREFGIIYAIVNITQMAGPVIGGILSQKYGLGIAFFTAAVIYCTSAIPLLLKQEVFVPKIYEYSDTIELFKTYPKKFLGYLGFGEELLGLTIWPIFIYGIVGNYAGTGVLATMASLSAAIIAVVMGTITDSSTKRVLVKVGAFFNALSWLIRFAARTFSSAFAIDSVGRTAKDVVFIPLSTLTYLRAEETHVLPYVVFFEQSLSVGKLSACLLGMIVFTAAGGGTHGFTSLFILASLYSLLYMFI